MDETDILPCPFCGGQPAVEMTGFHLGGRTIRCETDDCMGPHTTAACVEDAVVQWNRRSTVSLSSFTDAEISHEHGYRMMRKLGDQSKGVTMECVPSIGA